MDYTDLPDYHRIKNLMNAATPKKSVRALLTEIVDYAGLFPPSQLSMAESVANYAAYKNSIYKWILGRFVVPVARLDEFAENAKKFFSKQTDVWKLSVLAGEDILKTIETIEKFNAVFAQRAVADALEIKAANSLEIENAAAHIPENLTTYFELPLNENTVEMITMLTITKHRAKIRTGGTSAEMFPAIGTIVRFMRLCLATNLPFKCTAGLHHPLRCVKRLTYEKDAPEGTMNGFLNVFLAAALLQQNQPASVISELLKERRADNFAFDDDGVLWRQEYFIGTTQLKTLRERSLISFGSCSFVEPVEDLKEIGLL
ncbi:MAG: hypothetical protein ACR2HG_05635 [Pyrinomonadaceae bacterium]